MKKMLPILIICQQPTKELLVIPPLPPSDLMYLASIAEQCGYEAKIKDYSLGGNFLEDLRIYNPNYIVANIATPSFKSDMEALAQAKKARLQILDLFETVITEPRSELSKYAPKIDTFNIDGETLFGIYFLPLFACVTTGGICCVRWRT